MPKHPSSRAFRSLADGFLALVAELVRAEVERGVARAVKSIKPLRAAARGRPSGRGGGLIRPCPVPGCPNLGAGPRNRYFCRDHARSLSVAEQKKLVAEAKAKAGGEGSKPGKKRGTKGAKSAARVVRVPARKKREGYTLNMSCRVEGCPNRSRGPRAGYICDQHRAELAPDEQRKARDAWNAKKNARSPKESAQSRPPAPVPPVVRKADKAEKKS